ncbi:MAG: histidine--tRNA ligase [Candidatus Daviesbacteria bacterium]|nr:histidine--tRNA ligase [Candidatus Daviesbacteria bacterium]
MKQIISPVKGTRDFYPEQMAFRNWLYEKIQTLSQKYGYQEYDGPVLEYLDLYTNKTSEEILKTQAFTLQDRDGRSLILRPELTPTFARMVAQKAEQLPKEIRWFSFGRAWRYEQPQKGRGREFFQWEINLLGPESPEADAEILAIAADYLKSLNLTSKEVVIKVSDRSFMQEELKSFGLTEEQIMPVFRIIDRKNKISAEQFNQDLAKEGISLEQAKKIEKLLSEKNFSKSPWLSKIFESLKLYEDIFEYFEFDPTIIRGFDYYTKTVFEAWDRGEGFKRALFGGGRFDNLTSQIGGPKVPGVGMAPGDYAAQVILEEYGKMPNISPKTAAVLVTVFNPELSSESLKLAAKLRKANINTELWAENEAKLDKQLKYADQKGIPYVIIIGPEEAENKTYTLKNLSAKSQEVLSLDEITRKLS